MIRFGNKSCAREYVFARKSKSSWLRVCLHFFSRQQVPCSSQSWKSHWRRQTQKFSSNAPTTGSALEIEYPSFMKAATQAAVKRHRARKLDILTRWLSGLQRPWAYPSTRIPGAHESQLWKAARQRPSESSFHQLPRWWKETLTAIRCFVRFQQFEYCGQGEMLTFVWPFESGRARTIYNREAKLPRWCLGLFVEARMQYKLLEHVIFVPVTIVGVAKCYKYVGAPLDHTIRVYIFDL